MIVIGGSLGGTKVLRTILRGLPRSFPRAVAVALHRAREGDDDDLLLRLLAQESALPVAEPLDKEPIVPGRVYLAPADYHLLVETACFTLSTDAPVQYARPSIDVLFESAADAFGPRLVAVLLTGANRDGADGCARVARRGGLVVVQDPATAESETMPLAAIEAAGTPHILPPADIGPFLRARAAGTALTSRRA
jgi:two-component system chemotaxis response regulator CheB